MEWVKGSRSVDAGQCVEVSFAESDLALEGRAVRVRDSKDPGGPVLVFTQREWEVFVLGVRDGEFDL